ncbi:30S ribosomal protein S7 [Candidatus Similichlamydia epinepheli]|uniref:30S ribosomal protein S7 n=1 Tax=Candidatus Similichlamydia epinepheli TaxID=1903953 RepID=UPI000D38829A|nr:30S ribosomal protein S7 [Candidatus Similichlamydia epinepheli]
MSRRRRAEKREINPDPEFSNQLLAKFINRVMMKGKKSLAQRIVYRALSSLAHKINSEDPVKAFEQAIDNVKPLVSVKSRRVGGATYQVPVELPADKRISMAFKWIIHFARSRPGRSMEDALALELLDAYNGQGTSVKKRDETHRAAEANKAFAHYKW